MELLQTMGLAFLGGLILNIMPCVLPVLTMEDLVWSSTVVPSAAGEPESRALRIPAGFWSRSLSLPL